MKYIHIYIHFTENSRWVPLIYIQPQGLNSFLKVKEQNYHFTKQKGHASFGTWMRPAIG